MAEQRNVPLESGGTIRITEAIMRGTGPQGPKGDKGDVGTGSTIKGSKPACSDITNMRGAQDGDAWICEETGHLFVYDMQKEETGVNPWTDVGKVVGPEGKVESLGAAWNTSTEQYVTDDYNDNQETTIKYDVEEYIDQEKVPQADGTIVLVPVVTYGRGSTWDTWGYQSHRWETVPDTPIHIIDVDVRYKAQLPDGTATTRRGPITIRLYSGEIGSDGDVVWNKLETEETRYMDAQDASNATMNLSWVGKTTHTRLFQVRLISSVGGYIKYSRVQTARAGGNSGPRGLQGPVGLQGTQGIQGPIGQTGPGHAPHGTIIAFAGGPEDIPGYYEREGDDRDISNKLMLDSNGKPIVNPTPDWLPCDGSNVPPGTQLYKLLGMRKTPDLRNRFIMGGGGTDWQKQGRLHQGLISNELDDTENLYFKDSTKGPYAGSNQLQEAHLPKHGHTGTVSVVELGTTNRSLSGGSASLNHGHGNSLGASGATQGHSAAHTHGIKKHTHVQDNAYIDMTGWPNSYYWDAASGGHRVVDQSSIVNNTARGVTEARIYTGRNANAKPTSEELLETTSGNATHSHTVTVTLSGGVTDHTGTGTVTGTTNIGHGHTATVAINAHNETKDTGGDAHIHENVTIVYLIKT